jgi:hypothetical protein
MQTVTLKSGAVLTINVSDLETATNLLQVVCGELQTVDKNISADFLLALASGNAEQAKAAVSGMEVNTITNAVLQLLRSKPVLAAFYACAEKCLHNGQKIIREGFVRDGKKVAATFEPEQFRGDLLPTAKEVIKANLIPFFAGLGLESSPPTDQPTDGQK